MSLAVVVKTLVVWAVILVLAMANGFLREAVLIPALGKSGGMLSSGLILSCLILIVAYLSLPWFGFLGGTKFIAIGLGWLLLTLTFEFSFGFLRGRALSEILEAYTFKDGNIWTLVLLVTAISPWLAAKLKGFL